MTEPEVIKVGDFSVVIVRSKRRTLTLEIGAEGLKARAPMRMRHSSIEQFIVQKRNWIHKHLSNKPSPIAKIELVDGAEILYHGSPHRLQIQFGKRGRGAVIDDQIILPVNRSHLPKEQSTKTKLTKFFKTKALENLTDQTARFALQMSLPSSIADTIKVRDYKRRWGSCDHRGRLSFNWRIVQAPPEVLDYVVVHELAHCHEFNHSKRFWRIVEQQMPDWRDRQNWLQQNGGSLYQF
jgi:predicted metal-dependent hydrolase